MHLGSDYIHPTPRGGGCRIRIYLPEEEQDAPIVICSELPNNRGTSVTYAAEQLAAEVIRSHRLPTPLLWIEHWAKERTDGEEETCELRFRARPPKGAPEMELMVKGAEYIYRNTRLLRHYPGVTQAPQARLADRDRLPNNGVLMPMCEPGAEWTRKATAKQLPRTPHEGMIQGNENRADRNAGLRCRMA